MARTLALQLLRGLEAHIPALEDGEFYIATDTRKIFVGLNGFNYQLATNLMATVEINGNANPTQYLEPNADGSINAKLWDGTNVLGTLSHPVQTEDASDGVIGAAVPTDALYIGANKGGVLTGADAGCKQQSKRKHPRYRWQCCSRKRGAGFIRHSNTRFERFGPHLRGALR